MKQKDKDDIRNSAVATILATIFLWAAQLFLVSINWFSLLQLNAAIPYYGYLAIMIMIFTFVFLRFRPTIKYQQFVFSVRPMLISKYLTAQVEGVLWNAAIGTLNVFDSHIYMEGPFCPNCSCKLNHTVSGFLRNAKWVCPDCKNKYSCPREGPTIRERKAEDIIQARIRRGELHWKESR